MNDVTIVSMTFPMRLTTMTHPQWLRWDERQWHVRRGRGWALTEHHLPSSAVVAAMDQSKLPTDNGC